MFNGPHSEETKKKMSKTRKGVKLSEKHKKSLSKRFSGNGNNGYKDGRSSNKIYRSWIKNKRNRLKGATAKELGGHSFGEWENLKKQYGNTCPCCKKAEPEIKLTEDHIIPLSKGGSDLIENIQPLCLKCNVRKHTKVIYYSKNI